jgi:predicted nucleotidyltransferase
MTRAEKQRLYEQVVKYLLPYKPLYIGVFGSFAKNAERTDSDLDVLVDFDSHHAPGLLERARLQAELEALVGRKVDLVKRKNLLPYIAQEVQSSALQVYP